MSLEEHVIGGKTWVVCMIRVQSYCVAPPVETAEAEMVLHAMCLQKCCLAIVMACMAIVIAIVVAPQVHRLRW
jgi:hypothetical protein